MEQEVSKLKTLFIFVIGVSLLTGVLHAESDTLFQYDDFYLSGRFDYLIDSLDTDSYQAKLVKARTLVKVGYFDKAEKYLNELSDASVEKAAFYYRMGDYAKALEVAKATQPESRFNFEILQYLKFKSRLYHGYIESTEFDTTQFYSNIQIFQAPGVLAEAEYLYDNDLAPADTILNMLSKVDLSALSYLDRPVYHFLKCRIYNSRGEYEIALNHFDELLRANYLFDREAQIVSYAIDSLARHLDSGQTLRLVNNLKRKRYYNEAIALLLKLEPDDTTNLELAWAYFGNKHYSKAADIFDSLTDSADSAILAEAKYGRAVCDYRRGRRLDGVNKLLDFADSFRGNDLASRALFTAGDFYMPSNPSKSIEIFSDLIDNYPNSRYFSRVLYLTGKLHHKNGHTNSAVETFTKYPYDNSDADLFEYWRFKFHPEDSLLLKNVIERKNASFYNYKSREKLGLGSPDTSLNYDDFIADFLTRAGKYLSWRIKGKKYDTQGIAYADSLYKYGLEYEAGLHLVYLHKKDKNYNRDIDLIRKAYSLKLDWAFFEILEDFRYSLQRLGFSISYDNWDRLQYPFLYRDLVAFHAKGKIDPYLAMSVIRRESRFDPLAVSNVGALGLMQLMPATAAQMAKLKEVPFGWLFEPGYNIHLGCEYLRWLNVRLKRNEIVVAAYNAGPTAAKRWKRLAGSDIETYIETIGYDQSRDYTRWVIGDYYWYNYLWPENLPL